MAALLIGYACCPTDQQDLTAQHVGLTAPGVSPARIYTAPTTRRSAPGAARRTRHRRRRRRRAPADHTQARHGKAVFRPDSPRVFKTATYVRTRQPPPQTNPELRNLHPDRTFTVSSS